MRRSSTLAIAAIGFVSSALPIGAQQKEPFAGFDAYVKSTLTTWKVPGAAVAIVRNDSVIYAKGYGVREIGKPTPVDEHTIFAIGSSSKAFTSAAVAMLVDSAKVNLDAPATAYLPGFQLFDSYASREITVRDLLSHRSGLARGELMWYGSDIRPRRDSAARPIPAADLELPVAVRLPEHHVPRGRAGRREGHGRAVGRLHQAADLPATRHDVQQHVGHGAAGDRRPRHAARRR